MKFVVRTFNALSQKGLERLEPEVFSVSDNAEDAHAYMLRSHKLHDAEFPANLLAVARAGAGYNNIPVEALTEKGVVVFNTPGANANAVKELVAAGLFLSARGIYSGVRFVESLRHIEDPAELSVQLEKGKKQFAGTEIAGKTLGIVGLGAIGSMVANMALELGMRVVGFDPAISVAAAWQLSSRVEKVESLSALLAEVDYLTLHVPANDHTRGLLNHESLQSLKPGARLLNFARDQIVDLPSIIKALDTGLLSRYVTDFPAPELFGRDDCLLLPHIGASTKEAEENCAVMAADQLKEYLLNGNIVNSVNFPATQMGRNGGVRLTFANKNVPRVLGSVLSILADRDINVIDMVNRSRGDVAYNIVDLESQPDEAALDAIHNVEGVIRLRVV